MMKNKIAIIIIVVLLAITIIGSSFFIYGDNEDITATQGEEYETGIEVINDRIFIDVVSEKNSYAIKVDTAGDVINDLDVRNSGPGLYATGIKIVASHVTIENCNVFDTPVGIAVWSSNNMISNCTFWNCEDEAILLLGGNNRIENCVFYNCCDGVELQHSSNNTFINCRFLNNYHAGIDGIHHDNNNNSFFSCVFTNNIYGVYFQHSKNNEFVNCTFMNNDVDMMER